MSFLPPFTNDIFISYARVNDRPPPNGGVGWVTAFQQYLEHELTELFKREGAVTIWRDVRNMGGNALFDEDIEKNIGQSAIFLALVSEGYLSKESYCKRELNCFYRRAQEQQPYRLSIGQRSRLFHLQLHDIAFGEWPEELAGMGGFEFHDGEPPIPRPTRPGTDLFGRQLRKLVDEIFLTLTAFRTLVEQTVRQEEVGPSSSGTVFMAHAEGKLRGQRRLAIEELKRSGVNVVTDVPPPHEVDEHARRVEAEMRKADLAVHLLDDAPGTEIVGAPEKFYSREQVELGRQHAKSQLIWVPKTLDVEAVEDEGHRRFLEGLAGRQGAYRLVTQAQNRTLADEILARLDELKRDAAEEQQQEPTADNSVVLLDTHLKDSHFIRDLYPIFIERGVEIRITPEGDDPQKTFTRFKESLKQASMLIVIFGEVASEWVCERLVSAQQIFVRENCPLKLCGVYTPPVNGGSAPRRLTCPARTGPLPIHRIDGPGPLGVILDSLL